ESLTFASATLTSIYQWRISPATTLNEQAIFSTDVAEFGNWRLQNGLNLAHNLSRILTVRMSHELKHVNRPAPGFRKTDTVVWAALVSKCSDRSWPRRRPSAVFGPGARHHRFGTLCRSAPRASHCRRSWRPS